MGVSRVRFGALLEHTWSGISGLVRSPTTTTLFRRAEQYRNEGRYAEAAELVARGLVQAPDSIVGHLLSAYLHIARRETEPARIALLHVLTLDPYHPRALLGLARIALEEGHPERATSPLDSALRFYPDFPEAQALRDMIGSWPSGPMDVPEDTPRSAPSHGPERRPGGRELIVARADGTVVRAGADVDDDRVKPLALHLTQVQRMASATLGRSGLGPLDHGVIETGTGTTFLLRESDLFLSATLTESIEIGAGLAAVGALWATLGSPPTIR
jgi:tetratricopeptide (TPR) repeat protein